MSRALLFTFVFLTLALSNRVSTVAQSTDTCDVELPFSFPVEVSIAKVGKLRFKSEFGHSKANFAFTNTSSKAIVSIFTAVELHDSQNHYMFTMLFHVYEPSEYRQESPNAGTYDAAGAIQLDKAMKPGEEKYWGMSTASFSPTCPVSARSSLIEIQYREGPALRYEDANAHREPVVIDASSLDPSGAPFTPPLEAIATIRVDPSGHASIIEVDSPGTVDLRQWLQGAINRWEFSPAFLGFIPVSGELTILFRFHRDVPGQYPPSVELPGKKVFQVADAFPAESGKRLWRVYLGRSVVSNKAIPDN